MSISQRRFYNHDTTLPIKNGRRATPRLVAQRWQGVFLSLHPGFKPQRVYLSPLRCFTCLLSLQDVQWAVRLAVVHLGKKKKEWEESRCNYQSTGTLQNTLLKSPTSLPCSFWKPSFIWVRTKFGHNSIRSRRLSKKNKYSWVNTSYTGK